MSNVGTPAAPATVAERLFWPITAIATLALGGFIYFGYMMFASPYRVAEASPKVALATSPAPVNAAVNEVLAVASPVKEVKGPEPAAKKPVEPAKAEPAKEAQAEEKPAQAAAPEARPAAADEAASDPPAPVKKDEPEVNPYMVPNNKPFLSHDMFEKKAPPRPIARPGKPAVAAAKLKTANKIEEKPKEAIRMMDASPVSSAASLPVVRGKIYVLKDGRRIPTVSTVDLGDSYGVKDLNSSYLTILKTDVSEVVNR